MDDYTSIQYFIDTHKNFLIANNIDIAHSSVKDEWFVYRFETDYHYYDYFIKFETVSQLIDIILQEMTFSLRSSITKLLTSPECEADDISDQIDNYCNCTHSYNELAAIIAFLESNNLTVNSQFFNDLKDLLSYKVAEAEQ